jgi:uncharacterized protein YacL
MPLISFLALGISLLFPDVTYNPEMSGMIKRFEPMMTPEQLEQMSFFRATIIIGLIWGIWHAPLILMGHNYPQHPQIGVFMMIILSIILSSLFLYITIKSKSVIAASIMHGTMNATAGISIMLIDGGNDLTTGMAGLAGFIALLIILAVLFLYDYFISKDKILINKICNYL